MNSLISLQRALRVRVKILGLAQIDLILNGAFLQMSTDVLFIALPASLG